MKKLVNIIIGILIFLSFFIMSFAYATDEYYRPWTSPKSSIIGGATYIADGYINKGQYTSYLQKFNVNPMGYYDVYNHQYMTNIRAPYTEAKKSYDGLKNLGILDMPLSFSIPVYLNMPDITTLLGYSNQTWGDEMVVDADFEVILELEEFPESYRRKLRVIHNEYPDWTFTAMHTGLDFYEAVAAQKLVGAIDNPNYYDSSLVFVETGWYMPSNDATAYFLDPRNSLSVERILCFQNLDYSDVYTEEMIASILKGSHMEGYSLLDNQTYASIFLEAGEKASINPTHIAARALVETGSGTVGSASTTGGQFTYQGITYFGLYNYFNIGATSGVDAVYKGLVWASGGSTDVILEKEEAIASYLKTLGYSISGTNLSGIPLGSNVNFLISKLSSYTVTVKDRNGVNVSNTSSLKTGYVVTIKSSYETNSYGIIILGDTNGDGEINSADLLKVRQHLLGTSLSGVYKTSADVTRDGVINSADLLRVRQHLLGTSPIS